jgi:alcohol dehydrogenase class IV
MAVIAAANAGGLGVIHSLAQTLGGFYDLPHGQTIALCFTTGLAYNAPAVPEKYAMISRLLGTDTTGMSAAEAASSLLTAVQQLIADLEIHEDLCSLGVDQADIPRLAALAMLDGCTPPNPRPLDTRDFNTLFRTLTVDPSLKERGLDTNK